MALYPRRVVSTATTISVTASQTGFVTNPAGYKGNQTFNTLSSTVAAIASTGGFAFLSSPSTRLRDVYMTDAQLDAIAHRGLLRQDQLTSDGDRQFNVWQSAAWNGYGFWYQAAGGHGTGYIMDLLMLRVADPVGVYRIHNPAPPVAAVRRTSVVSNPAGVGAGCYIPQAYWDAYAVNQDAFPYFGYGPLPQHQYNGWFWDATNEKLIVGGDRQTLLTNAVVDGALATSDAYVSMFDPYGSTPATAWTRHQCPSSYSPAQESLVSGVRNSNGTYSFRSIASDYQTCTFNPTTGVVSLGTPGTGPRNVGEFGATFHDTATGKYFDMGSGSFSDTFANLYDISSGSRVFVCTLPFFVGGGGSNYFDNQPAGVIVNSKLYMIGHTSACNPSTGVCPVMACRVDLATGVVTSFSNGFTVTDPGGVNGTNSTGNGFHNRWAYVPQAGGFVCQFSPKQHALLFRPPSSWGAI